MNTIAEIITKTRAYYCLDCGKCTGVCPVSRANHNFSPRSLLMRAVQKNHDALLLEKSIWECLTCGMCEQWCPAQIKYMQFMRQIRSLALGLGEKAECSHGGAFQSLMRIMTASNLKQNRLAWVTKELQVASKGEIFYFVGCAPFFDVFFADLQVNTLSAARAAIKLLNTLDIKPVLSPDERCCGHDLLWSGDIENFKKLAQHNIQIIADSGAKTVVFSCPEGYQTFKQDYPEYVGKLSFDVIHISEFISANISTGKLRFCKAEKKVTYHDPCRLGRHLGVYDAPRTVMNAIPELQLIEMIHSRHRSICCGVGNWLSCGAATKMIQTRRLQEAKATGAEVLVTACPKCEIHLKCALQDEQLKKAVGVEIKDLMSLAAESVVSGER